MKKVVLTDLLFVNSHWKKLMDMTGMKFDLNPETFTLQNMFAMELHKFSDVIADITASATKELGIEKV